MTNDTRLKVLVVATEVVPFAKEGGVADVIGSLPKELAALGHDVRIFLPRYGTIDRAYWGLKPTGVVRTLYMAGFDQHVSILQTTLPDSPVIVYLLDHEWYFGRHQRLYLGLHQHDDQLRLLPFSPRLLDALPPPPSPPPILHLTHSHTPPRPAYLPPTYPPPPP